MIQITNRAVIIVRPKAPFIEWVRSADEDSKHITAEDIAEEPNVYLVNNYEIDGERDQLIADNYEEIFEDS
jgi:hypothetical protein